MMYGSWDTRHDKHSFFVILSHFLPFDPPNNLKNQNFEKMKKILKILSFYICIPQMMIIWCLVPEIWSTTGKFFYYFGLFFALFPLNNSENQNFEKIKKVTIDIIILQMCTINENDMIYGSWDVEPDRLNFFSFWTIFCPFTPLTTQKIKNLKKMKKTFGIS